MLLLVGKVWLSLLIIFGLFWISFGPDWRRRMTIKLHTAKFLDLSLQNREALLRELGRISRATTPQHNLESPHSQAQNPEQQGDLHGLFTAYVEHFYGIDLDTGSTNLQWLEQRLDAPKQYG